MLVYNIQNWIRKSVPYYELKPALQKFHWTTFIKSQDFTGKYEDSDKRKVKIVKIKTKVEAVESFGKEDSLFPTEHLSALRFNSREDYPFVRAVAKAAMSFIARQSFIIYQRQAKKGKKKTDRCERKSSAWLEHAILKTTKQSGGCAFALLCLFIPCGQTWTPYTRCWSRQARSVGTRQTHHLRLPQQNIPPPVQHLRQRGPPPIPVPRPPLVRRTTKNSCRPWNVRRNPENFPTNCGGLHARHSSGS